jgi:hypothetical protein
MWHCKQTIIWKTTNTALTRDLSDHLPRHSDQLGNAFASSNSYRRVAAVLQSIGASTGAPKGNTEPCHGPGRRLQRAHEAMGIRIDPWTSPRPGTLRFPVGAFLVDLRLRPDQKEPFILQRA